MLGYAPFYWQTTRRCVVTFGNVFKDVTLVKYNANDREEISRRIVPLTYAPKENYIKRLLQLPELTSRTEFNLPSMSFELKTFQYAPARKLQSLLQNVNQNSDGIFNQYVGVPYDLGFELNLYIRNIDDGLQIIEQIIPFFAPDYTLTMDFIDEMNIVRNVPLILDSVNMDTQYQGDATGERRLEWTLNFTLQTSFYGPAQSGGIITSVITNLDAFPNADGNEITLDIANTPLGDLAIGETVYQGVSLPLANAVGTVVTWNPLGSELVLNIINGNFLSNINVEGTLSGSSVEVIAVDNVIRYATMVTTPIPANANNISEDFGFTTYLVEYPATESFVPAPGYDPSTGGGSGGINPGGGGNEGGLFSDAYNQANNAYAQANIAYSQSNTALSIAELAYAEANAASGNNTSFNILTANTLNIADAAALTSNSGSTTVNSPTVLVLDAFATAAYTSVKYFIQLTCSQGIQTTELVSMTDGINAYATEYATLISANSLGVFSTSLSGANFNLNYTPYNPNSVIINWKWLRQVITS